MFYSFVLSLLLAHFLADFPLQSASLCKLKLSHNPIESAQGFRRHVMIHTTVGFFAVIHYLWTPFIFLFLLVYGISHYLIDRIKKIYGTEHLKLFFIDQLLHITAVLLLVVALRPTLSGAPWLQALMVFTNLSMLNRVIAGLVLLSIGLWVTGVFIRIYIMSLKGNSYTESGGGATDGGYLIGLLERLLVITAIATNNAAWASLVLGVKSIARFRKFDDDAFVEYFLIGSFISIFVALFIGIIIQRYLI